MKCEIFFKNGAETGVFKSTGELVLNGEEYTLCYSIDGDDCRLTYYSGEVVNVRKGKVALEMRFKSGEITECALSDGGQSGNFSVFTKEITSEATDVGIKLKLIYRFGGEDVNLKITAGKIQEQK